MEYAAFERAVRERADLPAGADADAVVGAALVTLSERVPDGTCRALAEQLPTEVGEYLTAADGHESFGYDEYVTRVSEREGATEINPGDRETAERHARAVVAVLLDAVQSRSSDDVLSHLTTDYEALFAMVDPEEVWGPGWWNRLGQSG